MTDWFEWFGLPGTFVLTWLMTLLSIMLAAVKRKKHAYLCAAAMFVSSCGDMFMTRFGNIEDIFPNYFVIGAAFFMIAHVLYTVTYRTLAKSKAYQFFNGGVIAALLIALACVVYFTIMCAQRGDFSMYVLCMLYLAIITLNCASIFSYSWASITAARKGGSRKNLVLVFCAVGALSFFLSDLVIGLNTLAGIDSFGFLIWWLYPIGQILINVFAF